MRILLVGNYEPSRQKSMQRFAELLEQGFNAAGHETRIIRPPVTAGKIASSYPLTKWLGYADQFMFFPKLLRTAAEWADVVHICDHSNAVYVKYVKDRPHLVTCHDVLAIRSALGEIPCHRTSWTGRHLQRMIMRGLREAKHLVCVSEATRSDLLRVAGIGEDRVSRIYNALNFPYAPLDNGQARSRIEKFGIRANQRFILHVGGNQWYKNRLGVLKIFAALKSLPEGGQLSLVMAGQSMTDEMRWFVRNRENGQDVLELVNPSNEDLRALYSSAEVMLFPSLQEGFGWPIIEAQACGCPVVTSNRAPMTEVGGDAATYIDPEDVDSASAVVARILKKRDGPCEQSLRNILRFETSEMIRSYLAVNQQLATELSNGRK